jgi:hypothetical protein
MEKGSKRSKWLPAIECCVPQFHICSALNVCLPLSPVPLLSASSKHFPAATAAIAKRRQISNSYLISRFIAIAFANATLLL